MKGSREALKGIMLAVAACASLSLLDLVAKNVAMVVPVLMALWVRYLIQAGVTFSLVVRQRGWSGWKTHYLGLQVVRGMFMAGTSVLGLTSLRSLPLAEFTAILAFSPLLVTLLAGLWLKEEVSLLRWVLVTGGFIGTLAIVRPGGSSFGLAVVLALGALLCATAFQLLTTRLARMEDAMVIQFYSAAVSVGLATLWLPFTWTPGLDALHWAGMAAMGVLGLTGHFLLTLAFRHASAATLTPFLYSQIGFAVINGWLFFHQVPDAVSVLGMLLIAACGAASAWLTVREHRT